MVILSLSSHVSNLLLTSPRAPATTGTICCCLSLQIFVLINLFTLLFIHSVIPSEATSTIIALLLSFSTTTSVLLASITWSHRMVLSYSILHLSFSTTPSGFSLLLKSCLQQSVQWINLAILSFFFFFFVVVAVCVFFFFFFFFFFWSCFFLLLLINAI